jgi:hypothetical protein
MSLSVLSIYEASYTNTISTTTTMSMMASSHSGDPLHNLSDIAYTPNRKRRAATPPPTEQQPFGTIHLNWMGSTSTLPETTAQPTPHREKRRRPNLANGLRGLSLTPKPDRGPEPLPSYSESQDTRNEVDEDDIFETTPRQVDDFQVEVLPNTPHRTRRPYPFAGASSSDSSGEESRNSEDPYTFTTSRHRNRTLQSQQSDIVEQPTPIEELPDNLFVQDVTEARGMKMRDGARLHRRQKRRRDDMDLDMDEESETGRPHVRWRKNTSSYEPEKDRKSLYSSFAMADADCIGVVVTSLSDTESEGSSTDVSSSPKPSDLNQPGSQGFTLSPSLLTHLLNTQRDQFATPLPQQEKGLILYRPLGIPPAPQIVQQWSGQDDSSRFEELDDDENTEMTGHDNSGGMEVDMEEPMELD